MKKTISTIVSVLVMVLIILPLMQSQNSMTDVVSAATAVTAPAEPTKLMLAPGYTIEATQVKLVWTDNSSNEAGFSLERLNPGQISWIVIKELAANVKAYTDTGLSAGTAYRYRVGAFDSEGNYSDFALLSVKTASGATEPVPTPIQDTPSSWAKAEVEQARALKLTTDKILSNYKSPITREEFCELVIRLYEAESGTVAVAADPNPFTDTVNPEILKAYQLGIIKGITATKFAPASPITRQEIAVMFQRELKAVHPSEEFTITPGTTFTDGSKIAAWALDAVVYMNQQGIMEGIGGGNISPKGSTTREQAIALVLRTYLKFGAVETPAV